MNVYSLKKRIVRRMLLGGMLNESSLLTQEKLKFDGSNIVPDFKAHERQKRKKVFE